METQIQGREFSVAVLMDDFSVAKEISVALRTQQIFAHHYKTLDELWSVLKLHTPDLVIIDVTKLSQGSVLFKQHPKVVDQSLSYALFSKESTKVLLKSQQGLKPVGFIHYDQSLDEQVCAIAALRKRELEMKDQIQELSGRVHRLQTRSERLITDKNLATEFKSHFETIKKMCEDIEADSLRQDFTHALISKLSLMPQIEGFGLFELNQSGQKLISPEISVKKFHPFPALWLGQTNESGIEKFAQEMARQVAQDLFEFEPVMIKLHGGSKNPDILLFISFSEVMINFPWNVFESMLTSSLRRLKLYQQQPQYSAQFLPMWEALDHMDKMQKSQIEGDARIITISLVPLMNVVKKRFQNKFFWTAFYNDFFLQLAGRIQKTTKLSLVGPWHVMFFIPKENLESETIELQKFIKTFSYWKFFEDQTQVLAQEMLPELKLMPPSSSQYLKILSHEIEKESEYVSSTPVIGNHAKRISPTL